MSSDNMFFEQFIEDYYSECDDHLALVRRALLDLEAGVDPAALPARLQELFRSLHTLKGLSGMVGLTSAERVAHAMEESLRAARQAGVRPDPAVIEELFASADLLARCIAARRAGAEPPNDLEPVLARLVAATPRMVPAAPGAPWAVPAADAVTAAAPSAADGAVVFRFEFTPSRALTERGVGVDAVRARLRSLGTVLDARPRVVDGSVVFEFSVAVAAGSEPDPAWSADGLRWTREAAASAPVVSASTEPRAEPRDEVPSGAAGVTSRAAHAAVGSGVVRVDLTRLDAVMRLVGDLIVTRSRLDELLQQLDRQLGARRAAVSREATVAAAVRDGLEETAEAMERQLRRLRDGVMRIRLVQVGEAFERLRFAVRDAARESGKRVTLEVHGQHTEIDKLVVDRMLEPLLHLVRNAVSHGIEPPGVRLAAGKPADGTVTLRAATAGDRIIVHVEDDGAGVDRTAVEHRARARGLLAPDERVDDAGLLDLLCAPGLSTRDEADRTSGRGIGMDVVRSTVRSLGGDLALETTAGRGTCFTVELPLTLMIVDALLVEVGDQQVAVPQPALREILQVDRSELVPLENNHVIPYRGGVLPLLSLAEFFQLPSAPRASAYLLVVGSDAAPTGILVDRLVGLREVVVQPITDPLVAVGGISGATELGDGRISLILDSAAIVRIAHANRAARAWGHQPPGGGTTLRGTGAAPLPA